VEYAFHFQDPTDPETVYLFEALVEGFSESKTAMAIFAFASRDGVNSLLMDPAVKEFLGRGTFDLIVGLDAVTNRPTLERLQELQAEHDTLKVRVFWNRSTGLFHPKIAKFKKQDGCQSVVVGSGNFTPGGLKDNFEAYSVMRAGIHEALDLSSWDTFLDRQKDNIRPIDQEALERASRNVMRGGGRRKRLDVEPDVTTEEPEPSEEETSEEPGTESSRILIAQIPKAGGDYGRWNQAHFNKAIMDQFFRAKPNSNQRLYLTERRRDGTWNSQEVRPVIYSTTNKNLKVELGARKGEKYPSKSPPIAVFRELQVRTFQYMILMPGEPGYRELLKLTASLPSVGKGLVRVLTNANAVKAAWPGFPL
jgi:HKD family nuclease